MGRKGLGIRFPAIAGWLVTVGVAAADPTTATQPDPAPRREPPVVGPAQFRPSWDLDGTYLWLGPTGAANYRDGEGDSGIGGMISLLRVRERSGLGVIGGAFGANVWTARDGGRLWLDAIVGTRLGKMLGVSLGPMLELAETHHPRLGGSVGVWAFLGVTPYVRAGYVDGPGGFVEAGLHIALPAIRW